MLAKLFFVTAMMIWAFVHYPTFIFALTALLPIVSTTRREWLVNTGLAVFLAIFLTSGFATLFNAAPLLPADLGSNLLAATLISSAVRACAGLAASPDREWRLPVWSKAIAAVPAISLAMSVASGLAIF